MPAAAEQLMPEIVEKFWALKRSTLRLRNTNAIERVESLDAIWAATLERKDDIFDASREERKTHDLDVAAELIMIKSEMDFAKKNVAKWMRPKKVKGSLATIGKRCEIRHQSKGVVLNMAAYNAPTAEAIVPAIAAIAAGNAIAIKPSELAPASAQIIQEIFNEALPRETAEVFQGGVSVAQELLALPFDHIYYTGGMDVGRTVMRAAAENFASITLEMGGKSPVIIDQTANLDNAATKIAWGRVMNAGQVCIAPEYVLLHESIRSEFLKLIRGKIDSLYNSDGKGMQNSEYLPRIINERHQMRVKRLIDDAVGKGAEVVCGGAGDTADRYIEPTVLTNMSEEMEIMQEEVFGPVLCILTYRDRKEVLDAIAKRPSAPLALYIYSTDKEAVEYFLNNTSSGSVVVNNNCIQSGTNPNLPFGGVGASGMGRIGGFEGFKTMSNARSVVHQPLDRFRDMLIQLPPYSERYNNLIMKTLK